MKVRVYVGEVEIDVEERTAYSPDVLEDILARTVDAATKLHLADLVAVDQLAGEAPPRFGVRA